jgi:hypothetical protein
VTGRIQSLATLGLMSVLAAGFGLWSAFSGPNNADIELHDAAANTLAASGFVETIQLSSSQLTPGATTSIDYQAPDRFRIVESAREDGGRVVTTPLVTQIGSECWVASTSPGGPSGQGECAQTSGSDPLDVLTDLEHTSDVAIQAGDYTIGQKDLFPFVRAILGPLAAVFKSGTVDVKIDGSYVSLVHLHLAEGPNPAQSGPAVDYFIRFTDVGSAPPVVRPASGPATTPTTALAPTPTTLAG